MKKHSALDLVDNTPMAKIKHLNPNKYITKAMMIEMGGTDLIL